MLNFGRVAPTLAALLACFGPITGCDTTDAFPDPSHDPAPPPSQLPLEPGFTPPSTPKIAAAEVECEPAVSSDPLRPRSSVMTRVASTASAGMRTDDLFEQFRAHCQGCHIDTNLGGFQFKRSNFSSADKKLQFVDALKRMRSDDPGLLMPPPPRGKPYTERVEGDPVRELVGLLDAWLSAGRPDDVFYPDQKGGSASEAYFIPREVGEALTNLGNCVPTSNQGFASEQERSVQLDSMFAQASELPARLEQTDLVSFDSKELARYGVVAFAPAYTLWADDAKKIRMVRVPRGASITFDETTQSFSIPPNTRFYKTFLKKVTDKQGVESYRKMETRVIVARPDDDSQEGLERSTALFGTYAWNEEETEAVLVRDPLRNGKPFRDRLVTYYLNEQVVEDLISEGKKISASKLPPEELSRKYAIPGSERCVHCHMGAPGKDFVLGFLPLQLLRRPKGEGGVIEETERDELNQLTRLIDYGVITGMASPDQVVLLEDSQGDRKPRTPQELTAQGYMLGNCAHCHNPRGFPSFAAPELRDVLDFFPNAQGGGIFEFPLDRFSPRVFRGANQNIPIPYITPSLFDLPTAYAAGEGSKIRMSPPAPGIEPFAQPNEAPWRSLIYRNVDAPFSYAEDGAIFPHMPRDTPGYDCRARQLLGSWMVSIPARWTTDQSPTDAAKVRLPDLPKAGSVDVSWHDDHTLSQAAYSDPQPYVEVKPDEPGYTSAFYAGEARVRTFQETGRHAHCPDAALDILDPETSQGDVTIPPSEDPLTTPDGWNYTNLIVPGRAHWFVMDLSEPDVAWAPRRSDWKDILVDGSIPLADTLVLDRLKERAANDRKTTYMLTGIDPWWGKLASSTKYREFPRGEQGVRITPALREFALKPFPLGLWLEKPACVETCKFADAPKVSEQDFPPASRPLWMDLAGPNFSPAHEGAPVYTIAPGAQVFTSICSNCHGPLADSRGRNADTIADLTGGDTRVANLRDGILGPAARPGEERKPGDNRKHVFEDAGGGADADDWAARYLLWMGLGGTLRTIPAPVLNVVAATRVMGLKRANLNLKSMDANMLALPEFLCSQLLGQENGPHFDVARGRPQPYAFFPVRTNPGDFKPSLPLFSTNGDGEFWEQLCTLDNPAPLRAIKVVPGRGAVFALTVNKELYQRDSYPKDAWVGEHGGQLHQGIRDEDPFPWCLMRPKNDEEHAIMLRLYREARPDDGAEPPYCPEGLVAVDAHAFWQRRGAMNAGLAVFVYLDELAKGKLTAPIAYDHCEELPASTQGDGCKELP